MDVYCLLEDDDVLKLICFDTSSSLQDVCFPMVRCKRILRLLLCGIFYDLLDPSWLTVLQLCVFQDIGGDTYRR